MKNVYINRQKNLTLHIGLFIKNLGSYGMILGYNNSIEYVRGGYPEMFLFRKRKTLKFEKLSFVTYVKDANKPNIAFHVKTLSSYDFVNGDTGRKEKFNGIYWDEAALKHILANQNYIEVGTVDCIYFSIGDKDNESIEFIKSIIQGEEHFLFRMYRHLKKLDYDGFPSIKQVTSKIESLKKYVEEFDLCKALSSYVVGEEAHFTHGAPGKDDMYSRTKYKRIDTDDLYIRSIVPLQEDFDYYSCVGRGKDEIDYNTINKDLTQRYKATAIRKYSKLNHFSFLLHDFYMNYFNKLNTYNEIWRRIKNLLQYENIMDYVEKASQRITYNNYNKEQSVNKYFYEKYDKIVCDINNEYRIVPKPQT